MKDRELSHIEHHANNNNMVIIIIANRLLESELLTTDEEIGLKEIIKRASATSNELKKVRMAHDNNDDSYLNSVVRELINND